jgi:hypothetical protein
MPWTRFLLAFIGSVLATSMTDWLFMGILFHENYLETPELWRGQPGHSETNRILISTALGAVSCAAFLYLCIGAGAFSSITSVLTMAVIAWLAGPVPIIFTNIVWTKMHPKLGVSHSLGWLARFVVTGLIGTALLP